MCAEHADGIAKPAQWRHWKIMCMTCFADFAVDFAMDMIVFNNHVCIIIIWK